MESPKLEYRAKLTEFALAGSTSHELITDFSRRVGLDRSVPHHFANYWVTKKLSEKLFASSVARTDAQRWKKIPFKSIQSAAKKLLAQNDAELLKANPKEATRFLDDTDR